jgi:hypothetical protein
MFGPHWGPDGEGFKIQELYLDDEGNPVKENPNGDPVGYDFLISPGHYYVDGLLCENESPLPYSDQPDYPLSPGAELTKFEGDTVLVYLDVWERHISYIQDDTIREVALGGPDTATRARVVWQVKVWSPPENYELTCDFDTEDWSEWEKRHQPENRGRLKAQAKRSEESEPTEPCITPPDARYRGAENQLYRVEIHRSGEAWDGTVNRDGSLGGNIDGAATFKWSRNNGAVVFPIRKLATGSAGDGTTTVTLEYLGRDSRFSLQQGDWVEIVDDAYVLQGRAEPLLKVSDVDRVERQVTLEGIAASQVGLDPGKHPFLRRWDQQETETIKLADGSVPVQEEDWLELEDEMQVYFEAAGSYRTGDYWLIPARTATGDVEWPGSVGNPEARRPHGVEHHYAPLAIISVGGNGDVTIDNDCRRSFKLPENGQNG